MWQYVDGYMAVVNDDDKGTDCDNANWRTDDRTKAY